MEDVGHCAGSTPQLPNEVRDRLSDLRPAELL